MHRPSFRDLWSVFIGFHLLLGACARHPAPAPGKLAPAPVAAAPMTAPSPTHYECATDGAEIPDDARRICVPYAGAPKGDAQALVTVVIFSDFQCPFCARLLPTFDQLEKAYPGKLRLYFRHMPLTFHADALPAARAAVAAENQGRFWPMHDLLFAHQRELGRENLIQHAQTLGLDMDRFRKDLDAPETERRIGDDQKLAKALGVIGTPNIFINGRLIRGAVPFEEFHKVIDDELQRAQKMGMQAASGYSFYAALMEGKGHGLGKPAAPVTPPKIPVGQEVFKVEVEGLPMKGDKTPKVTLVAFMDLECPYSARAKKTLDTLLVRYPDDLRVAFRHFPLPFHKNAKNAALAAIAAEEQGQFWPMVDLLLADQMNLQASSLEQHAANLGLDLDKYRKAIAEPKNQARVERDVKLGSRLGVEGTPSFFVNGRRFAGAYPLDSFVQVIDDELKHAQALLASGVKPAELYAALTKNGLDKASPKQEADGPQAGEVYKVDIKGAPIRGAKDALVTIVEFSDFQCPFCARVQDTLAQLLKDYPGQLRLVWRNLPLSFHKDAKRAALAALAAAQQGKFWEMHDRLFAHQADLSEVAIDGHAQALGLDMVKFKAALQDDKLAKAITDDMDAAGRIGAKGTPAFFINGTFLSGAQPLERFKERIDEALAKAKALVKKGTPKAKVYDAIMKKALAEVAKPAAPIDEGKAVRKVELGNAPSRGPADAPVTLVVFSDFQCPFCLRLDATLAEVEKSYPGKLRIVWKNFPLSFHAHGKSAAEAALAAHEQGKFWPMQAKLFENQSALGDLDVQDYAREIGLDMKRFKAALASHKLAATVEADIKQGTALGVVGSPTTFVNGNLISGAQSAGTFKAAIDKELAKASAGRR